jgi:hypothetical protein
LPSCSQKEDRDGRLLLGLAVAQAVNRWTPTAATRVRAWAVGVVRGQLWSVILAAEGVEVEAAPVFTLVPE